MNRRDNMILYQKLEIPEAVEEKAQKAFAQIRTEAERGNRGRQFRLPAAAAVFLALCLVSGTVAAAAGIVSLYRQRMEEMSGDEIEEFYTLAGAGETTELSRGFSEAEKSRYEELEAEYERNGRFPESELATIQTGSEYTGRGVALDETTRTIYLPEEALSDEELLQIIDLNHKVTYSIYEQNQERILSGEGWESRMAALDDAEVDRIYLAMFSAEVHVSGAYSRQLTQEEKDRREELAVKYETEGVYAEEELTVIQTPAEYAGSGVALCVEDATYYLPERELTDGELLQIIDFDHKTAYCLDRIRTEIQMGFREEYPR